MGPLLIVALLFRQAHSSELPIRSSGVDCSSLADHLEQQCLNSAPTVGESLLQARSGRLAPTVPQEAPEINEFTSARDVLPEHIYKLGLKVLGDEAKLNAVVRESTMINIIYGLVPVTLRIRGGDSAAGRLGSWGEKGDEYELDTLPMLTGSDDMVKMLDIGGNYGLVSIATAKKFQGRVRAVVVEPVATTYFFLRWNLWLNDVPTYLTKKSWDAARTKKAAGVLALNMGVTQEDEEQHITMCAKTDDSMDAKTVDAKIGLPCDCNVQSCTSVPGVTTETLIDDYFQEEDVTLLKIDCEGCESKSLPALAMYPRGRIKRLAGELHIPKESLIDIACRHDDGKFMTKVCRLDESNWKGGLPLECNPGRKICTW